MATVKVYRPVSYELTEIAALLGSEVEEVKRTGAPTMLLDGRAHHEANRWLELRLDQHRNLETTWSDAKRLRDWIGFLADVGVAVHDTDETHYRAYEAAKRWPDDAAYAVGDGWWSRTSTVIKLFHEWLRDVYGSSVPFTLVRKYRPDGTPTTGIAHAGRMTTGRSGATPLDPAHADALVAATRRLSPTGRERADADRDRAFVQLLLGTGMRLAPSSLLTHYELPSPGEAPLVHFHIPAQINKYKRGVTGYGFAHRIRDVQRYVAGERRLAVANTRYDPCLSHRLHHVRDRSPLQIIDAGPDRVLVEHIDGTTYNWAWDDLTAERRLRLLDFDGSTPLLFVASSGRPLADRSLRSIVNLAARHAHLQDPRFPQRVYPHMLRHTYGTHMAALWIKGLPDPDLDPAMRERFRGGMQVINAVQLVQAQLGHRDERTTRIYTQHVNLLLSEPVDRLLGG